MKRNCAVCGDIEKDYIFKQKFVIPSANYFHSGYDVAICKRCNFAYADNIPEQSFLDEYYKNMTKKTSMIKRSLGKNKKNIKHLIEGKWYNHAKENSVNNIMKYARKDMKILDIGAYFGGILYLLKQKGYKHLLGLDTSPFAAQVAKEVYGIKVVVNSLFDELHLGKFDFIILTHVLEHVADLRTFIYKMSTLLNDNGQLYIEVPDAHAFFYPKKNIEQFSVDQTEPLLQFSVEHVNYFSKVSLFNLMKQSGFDNVFLESQVANIALIGSVWKQNGLIRDEWIRESLETYIKESKELLSDVMKRIDTVVKKHKEVYVWGAGLHTQKLLAASSLGKAKIHSFVDSDISYHQGTLMKRPIIAPDQLKQLPSLPIIISSDRYQEEISKQIRNMGLKNKIVTLYDKVKKK